MAAAADANGTNGPEEELAEKLSQMRTDRTLYEMVCSGDIRLPELLDGGNMDDLLYALRVLRAIDHSAYTSDRAIFCDAAALRDVLRRPQSERALAIRLEMCCFEAVERALANYSMDNCAALMRKIVYASSSERRNKSTMLFDLLFFTLCRCRCALATWQSAR